MARTLSSKTQKASHIERVGHSLKTLVFLPQEQGRATLRKYRLYYGAVVCLFIIGGGMFILPRGKAESATFYPESCLGGWANPKLSEGTPDTEKISNDLSASNSAYLDKNTSADLYCGGFTGDIPEQTAPVEMELSIFWKSVEEGSEPSVQIDSQSSSSTLEILDSALVPDVTISSSTIEAAVPAVDQAPAADQEPGASVDGPQSLRSNGDPLSVLLKNIQESIFTHVYAQTNDVQQATSLTSSETVTAESTSTVLLDMSTTTIDVPITDATNSAATTTNTTTDTSSIEHESTGTTPLFEVLYTLDGKEWKSLGKVSRETITFNTFVIPLAVSSSWADVGSVQIKIQSLLSVDQKPAMYLDGMRLSVKYDHMKDTATDSADPKRFAMAISTTTGDLMAEVISDPAQGNLLQVTSKRGGSLFVYKENEENPVYSIGIGSSPQQITSSIFEAGNYVARVTARTDACVGMLSSECEADLEFIGKINFSLTPTRETPIEYIHMK